MSENLTLPDTITQESDVPLYFQLVTLIKRQINSGMLKPGDMIPSESQLCSTYNLSRSTVRQALNQLVEEGLLIRRRGKGSFVAKQKLNRNLNHLYSFTEDMLAAGLTPRSEVLENTVMEATEDIINFLELPKDNIKVFKLTRLRLANEEPLLIETTYIPLFLCPNLVSEDFTSGSLYNILRAKYNLNLHRAIETYEAIKLNKETCKLLKCKYPSTAFNIQRIGYLDTGTAFELTNSITPSDKCVFKVELFANKNRVNFTRQINI